YRSHQLARSEQSGDPSGGRSAVLSGSFHASEGSMREAGANPRRERCADRLVRAGLQSQTSAKREAAEPESPRRSRERSALIRENGLHHLTSLAHWATTASGAEPGFEGALAPRA